MNNTATQKKDDSRSLFTSLLKYSLFYDIYYSL